MELEQMINETRELSQWFHEVVGPWDGSLMVTHLAGVVGRLADDVMTIEGKLACLWRTDVSRALSRTH